MTVRVTERDLLLHERPYRVKIDSISCSTKLPRRRWTTEVWSYISSVLYLLTWYLIQNHLFVKSQFWHGLMERQTQVDPNARQCSPRCSKSSASMALICAVRIPTFTLNLSNGSKLAACFRTWHFIQKTVLALISFAFWRVVEYNSGIQFKLENKCLLLC